MFPAIPARDYRDSIVADFEWARVRMGHAPGYFVLNACRVSLSSSAWTKLWNRYI